MMSAERDAFEKQLSTMFGAWNRVLSADAKDGYWKGCELMTLPDFIRCCSKAIQTYTEDSTQRLPDVGALWAIKRSLRATPVVNRELDQKWHGDHWDEKANIHLLEYVARRPKRYSDGNPNSEYTRTRTAILLEHRNQWAAVMREAGRVERQDQKDVWANCMAEAEKRIEDLHVAG